MQLCGESSVGVDSVIFPEPMFSNKEWSNMNHLSRKILLAAVTAAALSPAGAEELSLSRFPVQKFKIDGSFDDKVWNEAASMPSFRLCNFGKEKVAPSVPRNNTSFRAYYDQDALCFAFSLKDSKPDKIIPGLPKGQTDNVPIASGSDVLEIFISSPCQEDVYYHLRVVPSGAVNSAKYHFNREEKRGYQIGSWNPGPWEAATRQDAEGWHAEIRIPFQFFSEPGIYSGTPLPGSSMRMNFCRYSSTSGEYSQWADTEGLFHKPDKFGTVRFKSYKFGEIALSDVRTPKTFRFGANKVSMTLKSFSARNLATNDTAVVSVRLTEEETDQKKRSEIRSKKNFAPDARTSTIFKKEVKILPGESLGLDFEFDMKEGGPKRLDFIVDWLRMKHSVHTGAIRTEVYPLDEKTVAFRKVLEEALKKLDEADRQKIQGTGALRQQTEKASVQLAYASDQKLSFDERVEACRKTESILESLAVSISNMLEPATWCAKNLQKSPSFCVGTISQTEKVFRDGAFGGKLSNSASLNLAGNEYESIQFVILYLNGNAGRITFRATDFKSEDGGVIRASDCWFDRIGYFNLGDTGRGTRVGAWPDVLFPASEVLQGKYSVQPILFTVKSAKDQKPGLYTGTVTFSNGKDDFPIQLTLRIYPFSLPDTPALRMDIWFWQLRPICFFKDKNPVSLELYEKFLKLLGKYKLAGAPQNDVVAGLLRIRIGDDGKYKFDFSLLKQYYDLSLKYGANVITMPIGGLVNMKHGGKILLDKNNQLRNFKPENEAEWNDQLLEAFLRFFRENGYMKYAVVRIGDEPWGAKAQEAIRESVARLRKFDTEVPVVTAGTVRKNMNLDGSVNIWCPQFLQFVPADYKDMKKDERLWFYQCLYKKGFPMYQIDRPAIEPRNHRSDLLAAGAEGFLYWTSTAWDTDAIREWKLKNDRWVSENWKFVWKDMPGDGAFVFPSPEGPVATLRANSIREGVDDYEYMAILRKSLKEAEARGKVSPALKAKAEAMLKIPDSIVSAPYKWTTSPEELDNFREKVAEMIIQLMKEK